MKLIELLVRELPKRGGWNENWVSVTQDSDGYLCCWSYDNPKYNELGWEHMSGRGLSGYFQFDDCDGPSCDNAESIVTRDQYQSALAASQKVEWSGECLPPVGCECEMQDAVGYFIPVDIIANHDGFAFGWNYDRHAVYFSDKLCEFRPLRSEADKKRDAMVNDMVETIFYYYGNPKGAEGYIGLAERIIEAIEIGKIPGVKLED